MRWILSLSVGLYNYIPTDSEECLRSGRKNPKKVIPSEKGEGREETALQDASGEAGRENAGNAARFSPRSA
jgi:hypothetical protein